MTAEDDPQQLRPLGAWDGARAHISRRILADVRHDGDLARLGGGGLRRWSDALLAETRFHLAGMINAVELALDLHVDDAEITALLAQLGAGYARGAIEDELGLIPPALLAHLRCRAAVSLMLRQNQVPGMQASLAVPEAGAAYLDTLAALSIAEHRWHAPMLLDAPMRPDLPAEHFHELAWTVTALLIRGCERLGVERGDPALMRGFVKATTLLISQHDEGQGGFALAQRCVRALPVEARARVAAAALSEARLLLFAAIVESETGLAMDDVLGALIGERDDGRHAVLRLMNIDDATAFQAAEMFGPLIGLLEGGDVALAEFIEAYRDFDREQAEHWLIGMASPRALTDKLAMMDRP